MPSAELIQRRTSAVEMVSSGHSYDAVAETLGYASRSGAWKAVQAALRSREGEIVDEYRQLNLARLDALLTTVWVDAMHGDMKALAMAHRILDSQSRLLGHI